MAFIQVSVSLVIGILVFIATILIGAFMAWIGDEMDAAPWFAWMWSSVGFALCLLYVLVDMGKLW